MSKGARWENAARQVLESRGYIAIRVSNSLGPVDVIAWNAADTFFIQVKYATTPHSRDQAKHMARKDFQGTVFPVECPVQLWLRYQRVWHIYDWVDGSLIAKERKP